ncbi:MAG: glutamate racemase, partial [Clostridium sp.]
MEKKNMPIGFFDSGVGGLSVMKKAIEIMPNEDYIYFGDSKNAPYGVKSVKEVRDLTFEAVEFLLSKGVKGIAVACNTATSAA